MQTFKRLIWLFAAGFVTAAGASFAVVIATIAFHDYTEERRIAAYKPEPTVHRPPPPTEVKVSELVVIEITRNGGVRGTITNNTAKKINSSNANLSFFRKEDLLYTCNESILVDVEPGKAAPFQLVCKDVERAALSTDITPKLSLVWVHQGRDE